MDLGISGLENATQIGSGASAVVYRALQVDLGREVAVKVLSSVDEDFVRRFKREARTLGKLSQSQGIVTVYDFGESATGHPYLVLELCSSSLLEQVKSSGPIEPQQACLALANVCEALGEVHDHGVVHRDIKPGNILISPTGRHLISDFGISTSSGATLGQTSTIGFTAAYAAPETFQTGESGPPSDVYALGATLFHLVAGRPPFVDPDGDTNLLAVLHRVSTEPVPDLRAIGISDTVSQTVEACMAKKADERPTMQQLAAQLNQISETGNLAFALAPVSSETDNPMWSKPDPDSPDPTLSRSKSSELRSGQPKVQPRLPPSSQTALGQLDGLEHATSGQATNGALSANEQKYRQHNKTEATKNPQPLAWLAMLTAVLFLGGAIVATVIVNRGDGTEIETAAITPSETEEADGSDEVTSEAKSARAPNSPTTSPEGKGPLTTITVPSLAGSTEEEAVTALESSGFEVQIEYAASPSVPEGEVIRSTPSEGTETSSSTIVVLVVSGGSETSAVNNVVGKTQEIAVDILTKSGFNPVVAIQASDSIAKGLVIRTDPSAGQELGDGATVQVSVSSGQTGCPASEIPKVVGETLRVATKHLDDNNLKAKATEKASKSVAAGNIISSTPAAATCVGANSTVGLVVSCRSSTIPNLVGKSASEIETLTAAGFATSFAEQDSASVPAGNIVRTTPAAGTVSCQSTPVAVVVSKAKPDTNCDVSVPKLQGESQEAATRALSSRGLTANVERVANSTVASGLVANSNPSAGSKVCTKSSVAIQVSTGPGCTTGALPNVIGVTQATALAKLSGFEVTVSSEPNAAQADQVIRTTPAAGEQLCLGTAVRIFVSKGPVAPETTQAPKLAAGPDVIGLTLSAATAKLEAVGFTEIETRYSYYPAGSAEIGHVVHQTLAAGADHDPISRTVSLTIGKLAPEKP